MGPANPWSPNWRPDPTGRRLIAIKSSRRGAFWAAVLLWPVVLVAVLTTRVPPGLLIDPRAMVMLAALSWPGLALLGAGLAPTAEGSRADAFVAAIALGIGAPVAAIASALIGVWIVLGIYIAGDFTGAQRTPADVTGPALGLTIQLGVLGALRVAPLVAVAVAAWIFLLRMRRIRPFS